MKLERKIVSIDIETYKKLAEIKKTKGESPNQVIRRMLKMPPARPRGNPTHLARIKREKRRKTA